MKEFSNLLLVTPVEGSSQEPFQFIADHFDYQPESSDEDPGISWNCDHVFVIERPDDEVIRFFCIPRSCILTLRDSAGYSFHIGTSDIPARVNITSHLYRCQLVVSCKMLSNPLF